MVFEKCKDELIPTLDALLECDDSPSLKELREKVSELKSHPSQRNIEKAMMPSGTQISRDSAALTAGFRIPPHIERKSWAIVQESCFNRCGKIDRLTQRLVKYLTRKEKFIGMENSKDSKKIFIGHGKSLVWRELKDFISNRLHLECVEFNREATAGLSTKERLLQMLNEAGFAFLILTAEDEHADGSIHARENVIHEVGLFQGRLGFEKAIILLEDGCKKFSNIQGITQIRFPKGSILPCYEEIRITLEREHFIN